MVLYISYTNIIVITILHIFTYKFNINLYNWFLLYINNDVWINLMAVQFYIYINNNDKWFNNYNKTDYSYN